MAKKKGGIETIKDVGIGGGAATLAFACFTAYASGDSAFPSVMLGFGSISVFVLAQRFLPMKLFKPSSHSYQLEAERSSVHQTIEQDNWTTILKWKEKTAPLPTEFIFSGKGSGLEVPIGEGDFYSFLKVAKQRQGRVDRGSRLNRNAKKIRLNWVLSERYFTQEYYPRFPLVIYKGCITILRYASLLIGRRPGCAGWLAGNYSIDKMLDQCKYRWALLFAPPTKTYSPFMEIIPYFRH